MPVPAAYLAHAATPGANSAVAYWPEDSDFYAPGFHIGSDDADGAHRRDCAGWPYTVYRRSIGVGGVDACICTGIQSFADARVIRDLLNGNPAPESEAPRVNLASSPHGAPYATGVDLAEAFPDPADYGRALRDLAASPDGFMVGGGAAPTIFVRPAE